MHIYFSGIGGSGLAGLAHLALDLGYQVSGSDLESNESIELLRSRGANIKIDQSGQFIAQRHAQSPIDWFLHTAALKKTHPEVEFVAQQNLKLQKSLEGKLKNLAEKSETNLIGNTKLTTIKISKRDEFINFVIKQNNLKLIAVAGTHGKTTTTAMLVWLFQQMQLPVSYLIGSNISFGNSGHFAKDSQYFVLECDEFDRNFLSFAPEISIIVSLDFDHPDTYRDQDDYNESFRQFCRQTKTQIIPGIQVMEKLKLNSDKSIFEGGKVTQIAGGLGEDLESITLAGLHNRQNAQLALFAMALVLNLPTESKTLESKLSELEFYPKINSFPGTSRRFEKLAPGIYSDYAHHPSEIAATLELAMELAKKLKN